MLDTVLGTEVSPFPSNWSGAMSTQMSASGRRINKEIG